MVNRLSAQVASTPRAAGVALATGAVAGLVVLGACSDSVVSKVAAPVTKGLGPRFGVIDRATNHRVIVCADPAIAPGYIIQHNQGPFNPGDQIVTSPSITNPFGSVNITATIPSGYSFTLDCANPDAGNPQSCVNGGYSSANVFHGSSFTYKFTAQTGKNCSYTQGYYKNHEIYTASVLSNNAGTTYITAAPGKLTIGTYQLTAVQIDAILETPPAKGYNDGGVIFTQGAARNDSSAHHGGT